MTSLEETVEERLTALRGDPWRTQQKFTIFRVPAFLRESSRTSYEPRLVSIGPYYRGAPALRAMEDHKWRYLCDLLSVNIHYPVLVSASDLVAEIRSLEAQARACYSDPVDDLNSDEFVQMLLLDGCFILEFFFKWEREEPDTLCDVGWGLTFVLSDLLLMENQIPFFVLQKIYDAVVRSPREILLRLLVKHIGRMEPIGQPSGEVNHILHLYYASFVPKWTPSQRGQTSSAPRVIPSAVEMSEAGVTFAVRRDSSTDYDVVFDARRGVMYIPTIRIDDARTPLLSNLIAFEQTQGSEEALYLSSYVALMGQLIVTPRDVALLRRRRVLENMLANDEDAARFFNHLGDCGAVNRDNHAFVELYKDVDRYCGTWWHRNTAALRRDYFASPWSAISFVAAAVAVALAALQTYFTIFPLNKAHISSSEWSIKGTPTYLVSII
ncbi:UPF0481 protein At3g47200-like [Oryza brachyantha]|uniref:Uncharacterized protein n=1 Tax=Oryza brachyantha TaxID=4533 RepID=J3L138_ORYBR|nr:UPF0481 protein At3g47200-like [Oryza brachyantha]